MMFRKGFLLLGSVMMLNCAAAQDNAQYERHMFIQDGDTMPYRLLPPKVVKPGVKYPLVIFLHGSGERGSDNIKQLAHGADFFAADSNRDKYPAYIVFPQCPESSYWSDMERIHDSATGKDKFIFHRDADPTMAMRTLLELEQDMVHQYPVNTKRIYVGGLSMGGMGTFEIVRRQPAIFAAAFAICGGALPATAPQLTTPAWWVFHGLKDDVVNPKYSMAMVAALKQAGARVKATYYPEANHNSWDAAFAEPELLPWLFAQQLK